DEYKKRIEKLKDMISKGELEVVKFKRYFVRHYVFLIQEKHKDLIRKTIEHLIDKCGYLFDKGF
ncbi:MAG: hypothetical protein DSY42_03425, partial [Aquifex sp.]